ncbi:hypothetical protein TNCV_4641421 [Trichonephila clavipes]|nr:hypothetical protein TNCV_4641421 [Trichonephila clavipes]
MNRNTVGRGSLLVTDSWLAYHELESNATEDQPCKGAVAHQICRAPCWCDVEVWKSIAKHVVKASAYFPVFEKVDKLMGSLQQTRGRRVMSSSSTIRVEGLMHVKSVEVQSPPVDDVSKFGGVVLVN